MRKCRVCSRKYIINTNTPGCCSVNCLKIRRKLINVKDVLYKQKSLIVVKFSKDQLARALKK